MEFRLRGRSVVKVEIEKKLIAASVAARKRNEISLLLTLSGWCEQTS